MADIRAHASAQRDEAANTLPSRRAGAHALRPGAHRRRRSRSALSLSTAAAVMIAAVVVVMGNGHSAVADEATPAPQPTQSVSGDGATPTPTEAATGTPDASPGAAVTSPANPVATKAAVPLKKLSKAAAHKASVSRASRAGRRGTKVYNIVYTATYARTAMGWSQREVNCLTKLWAGESNFRTLARNRHSGAYGIPQALPGRKMRFEGRDWKTNPDTQIRWGVKYVKIKYGTPCKALKVKRARGWY